MSIKIFLSTVSDEFRSYRDQLRRDLTRHDVEVKVQEDFVDLGGDTLDKLDSYIAHCDAVVHLVGDMTGAAAHAAEQDALLRKHPDLPTTLPPLGDALSTNALIAYTHWEAWLALYHGKLLLIARADNHAPRDTRFAPTDMSRAAQRAHLTRLEAIRRYPGCVFLNPADLARHVGYSAILDLLVKGYAAKEAQAREVAEGFIREMAKRVAADKNLDFDGMKQAVRTAIGIYEKDIAGGMVETNIDSIVDFALGKARAQLDKGQSSLARATLRHAAEEMRREEQERREKYEQAVRLLYTREKDIALAAYDGEAAANALIELAQCLHIDVTFQVWIDLEQEINALYCTGRERGSYSHLVATVHASRELVRRSDHAAARIAALNLLGSGLHALGLQKFAQSTLEEAAACYRAALSEIPEREFNPLRVTLHNNLGATLFHLGERDSNAIRLKEAICEFHYAIELSNRGVDHGG